VAKQSKKAAQARIGISGWRYGPWRGTFYPEGLAQRRELEYASRQLNSIEINGSFYSLQRPKNYQQWYAETPDDFVFSVKGGRYITHMRKLVDVEKPLANFLASGLLALREKLGPILWQFPPHLQFNAEKFEAFFKMLPRTTGAAAQFAQGHDPWMKARAYAKADADRPLRHAVEVRHASFENAQFIDLLRAHDVAFVFADTAGRWPYAEDLTSDFVYARLHGDEELYVSGYDAPALDRWSAWFDAWRAGKEPADAKHLGSKPAQKLKGRDVFVYFDNDVKVRAPFDAMGLARRLGVTDRPLPVEGFAGPDAAPENHPEEPRTHWPPVRRKKTTKAKKESSPSPPPSRWPRRPASKATAKRRKAG
jgi:uncharacterized protein YecE (DUF72 family)